MALELQTCYLVHPHWLPLTEVELTDIANCCLQGTSFEATLSRHLIDTHHLMPLTPELFSSDWTYCVAGGHRAMQALSEQVTSYLIATWIKSTISGEHARGLSSQLGKNVYEQALQSDRSLQMWAAPKSIPTNALQFLAEKSRILIDGLWLHHSPGLADWAHLMFNSRPKNTHINIDSLDPKSQGFESKLPYSIALLDEIDQRLQVDFSIDASGVFKKFALA